MSGTAWRLLWWLIANMESDGVVRTVVRRKGWRQLAAGEMRVHRTNVYEAERQLNQAELIQTTLGEREARVVVRNLVG